jgi:hypothetical protein
MTVTIAITAITMAPSTPKANLVNRLYAHFRPLTLQEVDVGLQVVPVPTLKEVFVLHPMHRTTHQVRRRFLLQSGTSTMAAWHSLLDYISPTRRGTDVAWEKCHLVLLVLTMYF